VPISDVRSSTGSPLPFELTYNSDNADGSHAQVDIGLGYGWTHSFSQVLFSQRGHMFRLDGTGLVTRYQLGAGGTFTASPGYFETLVHNPDDSFTLRQKDGTVYRFARVPGDTLLINGPVWRLISITDRIGNVTTLTYTAGQLTQITDTYGRSLILAYNSLGHLLSITDPLNRITTLKYDSTGRRLASITDPLGRLIRYTYNVLNQITSKLDKDNRKTAYVYQNGKPVSAVDGNGKKFFALSNPLNWATDATTLAAVQMREYLPSTTTETDGRGNLWKYEYDKHGYLTKKIASDGARTTHVYDPATLKLASETDANIHTTRYEYDVLGNRTKVTDHLGNETRYEYEPVFSNVTRITYPNGSITQYQYDAVGNRSKETRDVGGLNLVREWTYDAKGNVLTETDPNGHLTKYEYDAFGNRMTVTDPDGHVTRYQYDIVGNRTGMTDANNHEWKYFYDGLDRLIKETDPLGFMTRYQYDGVGNRTKVKRQFTQAPETLEITRYQYDVRSRLIQEIRDPGAGRLNLITQYAYDGNDNRVTMTDPRGKVTNYAYDMQNRLSTVTDALLNVTQTQYDPVGNRTCVIDANWHYTFFEYDDLNRLSRETRKIGPQSCATADADDILTRTFYDSGNAIPAADCKNPQCAGPIPGSSSPASMIDPENKYTYFKYDHINRGVMTLRKVGDTADSFDSNDWSQITQYDSVSNVLARIDANGNPTTYTYFDNNWLKTQANALSETSAYTYDGVGNVKTVQSPGNNLTTNTYNDRNELIQVSDAEGPVAGSDPVTKPGYVYDGVGNRTRECDGNDHCTRYAYDAVNRLIAVTDALDQTAHHDYDPAGNLIKTLDREAHAMCYVYDDINRRIRQVQKMNDTDCLAGGGDGDADDVWTKTVYDRVGNVTELTTAKMDAGGTPVICNGGTPTTDCETTHYVYDEVNRLVQETYPDHDPDKDSREFAYDKASNLIKRTDQKNRVTDYFYNDLYYLTRRDYDTDPDDSFGYDVGGRMTDALRDGWLVGFDYDYANRVLHATQDGKPVDYAYDIPNRCRTLTYPGGKTVTECRDFRERLDAIDDTGSPPPIVQYTYDFGNRVLTRAYRNGTQATYAYNDNNWITDLTHTKSDTTPIAGFGHDYDREGNKRFEEKQHDTGHSEGYQYDDLYRLITYKVGALDLSGDVLLPLTQTQYDLDKLGNWDKKIKDGATETRQHNAVNEITRIDAVSIASDADGNLLQDDRYIYEYDQENRLVKVSFVGPLGVETAGEYRYDALSRRIVKKTGPSRGGSETRYFYDGARIVEEQSPAATLATYTYGTYIDEVLTMERDTGGSPAFETYYYHQNALWSVEAITDNAQNVVERYSYDAYGKRTVLAPDGSTTRAASLYSNDYGFTGLRHDPETGLIYGRARMYHPTLGRWIGRDPFTAKQWNDPIAITDERLRLRETFDQSDTSQAIAPMALDGYPNGFSLYSSYFVPNSTDPSGLEKYLAIGVTGIFGAPSGAWDAVDKADNRSAEIEDHFHENHPIRARGAAQAAVENWMRDDKTQQGCECKSIMIVAVSWGATNSVALAEWFKAQYEFPARIHVMIEGVSRFGRPYDRIGPAEITNNYWTSESHWPRGAPIPGSIGHDLIHDAEYMRLKMVNRPHIAAEWAGSTHAVADLLGAVRPEPECGH
jgi:RHS repeat-associated protein